MRRLDRSTALKLAAAITLLMSLLQIFVYQLGDLLRGADAVNAAAAANQGPPYVMVLVGFVVSILALVAAYGAWHAQRWGIVLTIVLAAYNELDGLGGMLFAPLLSTRIIAGVGVVLNIFVIVLCLWRERKPVLA